MIGLHRDAFGERRAQDLAWELLHFGDTCLAISVLYTTLSEIKPRTVAIAQLDTFESPQIAKWSFPSPLGHVDEKIRERT